MDFNELWPAIALLKTEPVVRQTFLTVKDNVGISGFGIAKQLDKNPTEIQRALSQLVDTKLISGSAELRDNFALTNIGFSIYAHPEWWR